MTTQKQVNPETLGYTLYHLLNKEPYKSTYLEDQFKRPSITPKIINTIETIYNDYIGIPINFYVSPRSQVKQLRSGDIVEIDNRVYLITGYGNDNPITWPRLSSMDSRLFVGTGIKYFNVIRPDLTSVRNEVLEAIDSVALESIEENEDFKHLVEDGSKIIIGEDHNLSDGFLQIGDLIFVVDPTQITLVTQNGYQQFPTIRTHGNPKIATPEQVKNISVSLIFPNQDSINYQLLNLFAMYKRTPFVNIRNKDVCEFFSSVTTGEWPDQWLSVALESIHIQSVDGFPNTLQATLTFLPFDPHCIAGGFQALDTMKHVEKQQVLLYNDRELDELIEKSKYKLNEQSVTASRFLEILDLPIEKSSDFRKSVPFRAFYQSLIGSRSFITDEHGNPIPVYSDNSSNQDSYNLEKFRPTKYDNLLFDYNSESNNKSIDLSYSYIEGSFKDIVSDIREQKDENAERILEDLNETLELVQSKADLAQQIISTFHTRRELFDQIAYNKYVAKRHIHELLGSYGIDLDTEIGTPINNIFDLLLTSFEGANVIGDIGQAFNAVSDVAQGKFDKDSTDVLGKINGLIHYQTTNGPIENHNGIATAESALTQIWDWINKGSDKEKDNKKSRFFAFLENLRNRLYVELGGEPSNGDYHVTINSNQADDADNPFQVTRLPLKKETVKIDNRDNISVGWSIIYANKFVPVQLQAFRYPYYQHLGSEDIIFNLNIVSVAGASNLKRDLSLLSERIRDTVEVVTQTAPELYVYLDSRINVDVPTGHVLQAFGLNKIVLNNLDVSNAPQQPNTWNINSSFTQANINLADYHSLESEITNNYEENEIANLLARIHKENGKYVIKKYINKESGQPLGLDDTLRVRFLTSEYAPKVLGYLNNVVKTSEKRRQKLAQKMSNRANATYPYDDLYVADQQEYSPEDYLDDVGDQLIGSELADQLLSENEKIIKKAYIITPDTSATTAFQNTLIEKRTFSEIFDSIYYQYNRTLEDQARVIMNIVREKKSTIDHIWSNLKEGSSDSFSSVPSKLALFLTTSCFGVAGSAIRDLVNVAIDFVPNVAGGLVSRGEQFVLDKISDSFSSLLTMFTSNIVFSFSKAILKDPAIKEKFINTKILGQEKMNKLDRLGAVHYVNCYNDFDIPYRNDGVILSPDFYLYNDIDNNYNILSYINSAVDRYAKIGKLCAMMSLVENEEALKKYDQVLKRTQSVDEDVLNGVNSVLQDTFGEIKIESLINKLENTQIQISRAINNIDEGKITDDNIDEYINAFKDAYPRNEHKNKKDWDAAFDFFEKQLKRNKDSVTFGNTDLRKLNLIHAARIKTLIEIFEIYGTINNYILENKINDIYNPRSKAKTGKKTGWFNKNDPEKDTRPFANAEAAEKLYIHIKSVLKSAQTLNSTTFEKDKTFNELRKATTNGLSTPIEQKTLSLPGVKLLQTTIYEKINFYIRLNTFIDQANLTGTLPSFDTIPELQFLTYWNFRATDANKRKTRILKEFIRSNDKKSDSSIKMFPTFKIYIVEEDRGIIHNFDDYYSYDAVNSIEVVSNKNSPGKTAVLRLSNLTNNLADRTSFTRERVDILGKTSFPGKEPDNLFFGTLDIKPGTAILIKAGYAPNDTMLDTIFQGRIIDMNVGPIVEMVCQSYGTQLNHHIESQKFGFFGTVKEHGDVAAAVLDLIPGLEKLGKLSPYDRSIDYSYYGGNVRNLRGKFGDNYLLSNIFGSISAFENARDNPRDENIYLPFSAGTSIKYKKTFNWIVFDQSVWESLRELCLYNDNAITTVRDFNNDSLSKKRDSRETLVLGNKSGYYKFTDAFQFSSTDLPSIKQSVEDFKIVINQLKNIKNSASFTFALFNSNNRFLADYSLVKPEFKTAFNFFQDKTNSLVTEVHVLKNTKQVEASSNPFELLTKSLTDNKFLPNTQSKLIADLRQFSNFAPLSYEQLNEPISKERRNTFRSLIKNLHKLIIETQEIPMELITEDFYAIKIITNNNDDDLAYDPQYRKIQTHHLVTDFSNLISNNISLSSNFPNMVNLYYVTDPKIKTVDKALVENKSNIWTVKAFGDLNDEHLRPLNSFQKNIDTNWFDVNGVLDFYQRVKKQSAKDFTGVTNDIDTPNWQMFPSFILVGVNLLKQEVAKMYQGTIEIIGNPRIQPHDIIHISDHVNDMIGAFEVEEVIHTFTPDRGYITVITPNLITYDRDPIQMQDVQVINQIFDFAKTRRAWSTGVSTVAGGLLTTLGGSMIAAGGIVSPGSIAGAGLFVPGVRLLYNGIVGSNKQFHKFLYDQMGNILGRDCINFTSLIYHGVPYMAGFDGIDYTNLKTLINHNVAGVRNPISRFAAFSDPLLSNIMTDFNPSDFGLWKLWGPQRWLGSTFW